MVPREWRDAHVLMHSGTCSEHAECVVCSTVRNMLYREDTAGIYTLLTRHDAHVQQQMQHGMRYEVLTGAEKAPRAIPYGTIRRVH